MFLFFTKQMQLVQRWVYLWSQWPLFYFNMILFLDSSIVLFACLQSSQPRNIRLAFLLDFKWLLYSWITLNILSEHTHTLSVNIYFLPGSVQLNSKLEMYGSIARVILYINETSFLTGTHLASLFGETFNDGDTMRRWINSVFLAVGQEEVLCVVQWVSHLAKSHHNTSNNWQLF